MNDKVSGQQSVIEYVIGLIQKKSKFPADCVIDELNYIDTGYIDSIAIIKFVLDIETRFEIEISDDDMMSPQFRTVGGLVRLIVAKVRTS